jgi:lysophospholipase L1-like esterase
MAASPHLSILIFSMKKVLFLIFLSAYSLFFAEWFLRFLNPQALLPRYIQAGPLGVRENIPNAQYRHWTPEVEVDMKINAQAMRDDRDYEIAKPEGICRVAIFGDSFFMGYEASLENSFAGQLRAQLNELGHNCQVLNFAVSGFGTAESLVVLQEKALEYSPDYVVLQWHYTDPNDNLRANLFAIDSDGTLVRKNDRFLPGVALRSKLMKYSIYRWAIEYSHLYSLTREKLASFVKNTLVRIRSIDFSFQESKQPELAAADESTQPSKISNDKEEVVISLNELLVNEFGRLVNASGAKFLLLDVPNQNFNGKIESSYKYLNLSFIEADAVLSPETELRKRVVSGEKLYREEGHRHFNEKGYSLVAEAASIKIDEMIRTKE